MTFILLTKKLFTETNKNRPLKIGLKTDYDKVDWQILYSITFHATVFVSVSEKDLAMVTLKLSSAQEVYPNKLSRAENKLSENLACVYITQEKLSHSDRFFLFKNSTLLWK